MKKQDILKELKWRGILSNITDEDKFVSIANDIKNYGIYVGFDPSYKSLHLGNYVMIRILKLFKEYGFKTLALVGGATGMIGDPSGKSNERNLLGNEIVLKNTNCIINQLKTYAKPDIIFNNAKIWSEMNVISFLRDVGKLFNVNTMLEKDIVKSRLDVGISYSEFSYSILQSWDWVLLFKNYNIAIQCGGSDQWGNITAGTTIFRKLYGEESKVAGITINLLTKSDGKKFGKSEKGAIYLDKEITSVYSMYQFLINQADNDLDKLFKFFTDFSKEEIEKIIKLHQDNPKERLGQKKLTETIISDIHGKEEYLKAKEIANLLFKQEYNKMNLEQLDRAFESHEKIQAKLENIKLIDFLKNNNIFSSNREIRTLIEQKGLKINGISADNENQIIDESIILHNKYILIKKGKKNFFVIEVIK